MKKAISIALCLVMLLSLLSACSGSDDGLIKVGIINNPPEESRYRADKVQDLEKVFTEKIVYTTTLL